MAFIFHIYRFNCSCPKIVYLLKNFIHYNGGSCKISSIQIFHGGRIQCFFISYLYDLILVNHH